MYPEAAAQMRQASALRYRPYPSAFGLIAIEVAAHREGTS